MTETYLVLALVLAFLAVGVGCFVLGGYMMEDSYKKYVKSIREDYRKIIEHKDAEICRLENLEWTQAKRIARLEAKLEMAKDYMTDLIVTD